MTQIRRRAEERTLEIRHRLVVDRACNGLHGVPSCGIPGSQEIEEELLDEVEELERSLMAGEGETGDAQDLFQKGGREIGEASR